MIRGLPTDPPVDTDVETFTITVSATSPDGEGAPDDVETYDDVGDALVAIWTRIGTLTRTGWTLAPTPNGRPWSADRFDLWRADDPDAAVEIVLTSETQSRADWLAERNPAL